MSNASIVSGSSVPAAASAPEIIVLKLGGSVLADESSLELAVHEVYRFVREGRKVVAVVSAVGETTNTLVRRARGVSSAPDEEALAALLHTGEHQAVPLLALALDRAGVPAGVLDSHRLGLIAEGSRLDADPVNLDAAAIVDALRQRPVVVVPGFVARFADGSPAVLGRGGSDLTALFIAQRLGAPARLLKDVAGLFEWDPSQPGPRPRLYRSLSWDEALRLDGRIVQHKALRFAQSQRLAFEVAGLNRAGATLVGPGPASFERGEVGPAGAFAPPLRLGLLGLGTVGLGVLRGLEKLAPSVEPTLAAVRSIRKHLDAGVPSHLLTTDPWSVVQGDSGAVVEAIGTVTPALVLTRAALQAGKHVITANKALIAEHGEELEAIARERGVKLLFGAAVGGSVPVLETIAALRGCGRRITRVRAVINGTTTFVLDRAAEGRTVDEAVRLAQACGFAEPDAGSDLDGTDAAHKLVLIARAATDRWVRVERVRKAGIEQVSREDARREAAGGRRIRIVAEGEFEPGKDPILRVGPAVLEPGDPLWTSRDEINVVVIDSEPVAGGEGATPRERTVLRGRGAGRWPTAESVLGDVLEVARLSGRGVLAPPVVAGEPRASRPRAIAV
jgi:homoserine dehydrogenase